MVFAFACARAPGAPFWLTAVPRGAQSFPRSSRLPNTVLARANRLVRADDYRNTVRRGRRSATAHTLVYTFHRREAVESRFGFIVSKAVGNAVTRNLIRRRLKSVCFLLAPTLGSSTDVVIRALPGADKATWNELHGELVTALGKENAL